MMKSKPLSYYKPWIVAVSRFIFLVAFSYILLYPILYMMSNAFRTTIDYIDPAVVWLPKTVTVLQGCVFSDEVYGLSEKHVDL